jgi:hypothetical protein
MYAVGTSLDNIHDLADAGIAAIIDLKRASGIEAAPDDGKDDGVEKSLIVLVEGTIYKNA